MSQNYPFDHDYLERVARTCLEEDVGAGDRSAVLTPDIPVRARLVAREAAVICGTPFVAAVFAQLDPDLAIAWRRANGESVEPGGVVCEIRGRARPILTGERSAINLIQTLSGTATLTRRYVDAVAGTGIRILDTRKTIPGLRAAQKWAVRCGGGYNHRQGLFDGILIKENHLRSGGSLGEVLRRARNAAMQDIEVTIEVETLQQLEQALAAGAARILLDNYSLDEMRSAVAINGHRAELEASGGVTLDNVRAIAETGVDCISVGAITKNVTAVDLSLQFDQPL